MHNGYQFSQIPNNLSEGFYEGAHEIKTIHVYVKYDFAKSGLRELSSLDLLGHVPAEWEEPMARGAAGSNSGCNEEICDMSSIHSGRLKLPLQDGFRGGLDY